MLLMKKKTDKLGPNRHKTPPLGLRPSSILMDLMRTLAAKNRRTLTAELEIAIEAHLASAGMWPLTSPEGK